MHRSALNSLLDSVLVGVLSAAMVLMLPANITLRNFCLQSCAETCQNTNDSDGCAASCMLCEQTCAGICKAAVAGVCGSVVGGTCSQDHPGEPCPSESRASICAITCGPWQSPIGLDLGAELPSIPSVFARELGTPMGFTPRLPAIAQERPPPSLVDLSAAEQRAVICVWTT